MRPWSVVLVLLVLLLFSPALRAERIDPKDPPQGRFSDDWLEIYMAGSKIGYGHSSMNRDGDVIRTQTTMHMRIGRVDQPVQIDVTQFTAESLDGAPRTFGSDVNAAFMQTSTKGTIENGKVQIVTSQYGMEQTQEFSFSAGALMAWGLFRESMLRGFQPGTEYALEVYAPELRLDGPVKATTKIADWEEFEHGGKRYRGQKVTVLMESPIGSLEMESWVDKDGMPIKSKIPSPGIGDLVLITADQKTALADFIPPELFLRTTIPATVPLDRHNVRQIKYRLRADAPGVELGTIPETDMQRAVPQEDGSVELTVTRAEWPPSGPAGGTGGRPLSQAELAEFLDANLMINTADPELVKLAKSAAGGETDHYKLADKLRRFVTDYIEDKNLDVGFATASEVCRRKSGDCSEHGVLLAALGRINGLPSRVVVGVAYVPMFGAQQDIFGYHLWTQFYIDGRWVDMDAALKETECSPARIAFAVSSLKNAGLADLSLPLISKIGAIGIDILEVDGRKPVKGVPSSE